MQKPCGTKIWCHSVFAGSIILPNYANWCLNYQNLYIHTHTLDINILTLQICYQDLQNKKRGPHLPLSHASDVEIVRIVVVVSFQNIAKNYKSVDTQELLNDIVSEPDDWSAFLPVYNFRSELISTL